MFKTKFFVSSLLLFLLHYASTLNILAIISVPLRSHYMAFEPLFRELANRGHTVTVINNFPEDKPTHNLYYVNLKGGNTSRGRILGLDVYEKMHSSYLHLYNIYRHLEISPYGAYMDCENLFTNENAKEHLARGSKYDVIFVEQFMSDCGLAYAGALYDAPIIGITSHVMLPWSYSRLGIPFDYAADAFYFSNSGPNPSLFERVESAVINFYFNTIGRWLIHRNIYEVFGRYLPNNSLDIELIAREKMKMMFVYQHFSLTGARLLAPQVLEIGGVHIGKPKTLPNAVLRFLSDAQHGAVYVSFGSNLESSTMTHSKLQHFLDAFKILPQKILWKWENDSFPAGNETVYFSKWLPQLAILCHPKVLAFVSHGGMLSISEAAHCGKPVLAIPFFGDQFANAITVQSSGLGLRQFFDKLNAENLAQAIKKLMSPEMQQNAQQISRLWHDRPQPVMDSAIYWTEYVARHRAAPPSLPAKRNAWLEDSHLDVNFILITLCITVVLVFYVSLKLIILIVTKSLRKLCYNLKLKKE